MRTENIPLEPDPGHSGEGKHVQARTLYLLEPQMVPPACPPCVPKAVTPGVPLHI